MDPSRQALLPIIAAAISGVLVGSAIVATRSVVDQAGPVSLALLFVALGLVLAHRQRMPLTY